MTMTDSDLPARRDVVSDVGLDEVQPVVRRHRGAKGRSDRSTSGGAQRRPGRGSRPASLWWQVGTTAVFAILLVGLVVVGYRASLLITGGGASKVTDPKAPGYVAEVRPTPVDMVAVTGDDGSLASVLIVATSPSGTGGTVSVLPASVAPGPGADNFYLTL
ncbi:MAG: hypothetical protein JST64_00465, partial [Actinobacteria bacterium]|nr:hypothetical protein [Actinomycetota bacterium]